MHLKPFISFCIPTYNRGDKVFKLVRNILKYTGSEIEVVVLDNLSTDNTSSLLGEISDNRFVYLKNEVNIGGIRNPFKALTLATGEFCFLCLDKDFVDHRYIAELIKRIRINDTVVFGYCTLNTNKSDVDVFYNKGYESISNMAYLSAHPTGMFYKTKTYKELPIVDHIVNNNQIFGFNSELINADICSYGDSLIVKLPVFHTETAEDCGDTPSFTYINERQVFFFPENRYREFLKYCTSLYSLNILEKERNIILKRIFLNGLFSATLGFKDAIGNKNICEHYHVLTRKVSFFEIIIIGRNFAKNFIKMDLPISFIEKVAWCLYGSLKIFYAIVRTYYSKYFQNTLNSK